MGEPSVVVAAVDLGASSGRVVIGEGGRSGFRLREVYRFTNTPIRRRGALRWDAQLLRGGVLEGLRRAAADAGHLDAVSVDGWAVDFGLLDTAGELIADPVHYRDSRTLQPFADLTGGLISGVDPAQLYATTGIAARPFNTVFQLMAASASGDLSPARHALLLPDLMTYWLSGAMGTELTNASTTQLLDPRTMTWASAFAERLGIPFELFPPIWRAGEIAGRITAQVAALLGTDTTTQLVVGPSHDTAAAIAAVPAQDDDFAFVCTGTWALVGLELNQLDAGGPAAGFDDSLRHAVGRGKARVLDIDQRHGSWQVGRDRGERVSIDGATGRLPLALALL
ncbi:MAG TPA: FGGY family carbohydrate kinase [Mycobacteriales bacterium]|nr:FGGY family carbohydrate kinase [Mycobacteriales bacterium]